AVVVQRLERPGDVGGQLDQEAGVRVAVRVEWLSPLTPNPSPPRGEGSSGELPPPELPPDADAPPGGAPPPALGALLVDHVADRPQDQDANAPDVAVAVEAGVGPLLAPVAREAEPGDGQLAPQVLAVGGPRRDAGDRAGRDDAVGVALALVQARRADQ